MVWAPPWPPAAPLLPGEVDTVRLLHVALHASRTFAATTDRPANSAAAEAGAAVAGASSAPSAEAAVCLQVGASDEEFTRLTLAPSSDHSKYVGSIAAWDARAGKVVRYQEHLPPQTEYQPAALLQVAEQLHGLGVLAMTHHRLAIAAPLASGGHGLGWWGWAGVDAHLPLHAAAAQRALVLLQAASGVLPLGTLPLDSRT